MDTDAGIDGMGTGVLLGKRVTRLGLDTYMLG
jgi:hypothetical protein